MEVTITKENFASLKAGNQPLVVDFWATWCGPCRMVAPIIEELANQYSETCKTYRDNKVDEIEDSHQVWLANQAEERLNRITASKKD